MALTNSQIFGIGVGGGVLALIIVSLIIRKTAGWEAQGAWAPLTAPFIILVYFLPYFVAFYSLFNDAITQSATFSWGVLLAIAAILINWWAGRLPPNTYASDLCGIPGLSSLHSTHIPQGPLFVSTIMGYILTYILLKQTTTPWYVPFSLWASASVAQYYTLWKNGQCLAGMQGIAGGSFIFGPISSGNLSPLWSIAIGGGAGAALAYLITTYYDTSSSGSAQKTVGPVSSTPGASPSSDVGTCSPPNDQDQFVCEAYKDGKLVTSTIASS